VEAWSLLDVEGAKLQAAKLTVELAAGGPLRPLHGVPVAVKDEFHIAGMPTLMRGKYHPLELEDATCVARLRQAGAVILGKTTMPIDGKNPTTRNPWNLEHTPGGTSSGSGAAVGARMVPFAIGEQTSGSNLRPAAYNGVDGMKPTYGRISRFGCYPFTWSRDHVGLIGVCIEDIALVLSVLAGPDERDPTCLPDPAPLADLELDKVPPPRIGVVRNFFPERAQPEMNDAIEVSANRLAAAGATVSDAYLPQEFGLAWSAALLVSAESAAMNASKQVESHAAIGGQRGRAIELVPATYYVQARRIRTWLVTKLQAFLTDFDALLMPVAPGGAPRGLESTGDPNLLIPWSFLGVPAVTINGGLSDEGLPLGLQFIAGPRRDRELLQVCGWSERVLGRLSAPVL
jgi:Asp-tRNA(Asn)/Glu-tRNA(Gln) amidotransferase A subunit family amidase